MKKIVRMKVVSTNWSLQEYLDELNRRGFHISQHTEQVIRQGFSVSEGHTEFKLVIFPGSETEEEDSYRMVDIRAYRNKFIVPPVEVALLLRKELTDQQICELGYDELEVLHEPVSIHIIASRIPGLLPQHLSISKGGMGLRGCHPRGGRSNREGMVAIASIKNTLQLEHNERK